MAIKKQNIGKKMISFEDVRGKIVEVRGQKVILDYAVAELYGVETREINQAVRNNPRKFPKGWMFELDGQESAVLRSKILMLKAESGSGKHSKHNYKAFTERGLYYVGHHSQGRAGDGYDNSHYRRFCQIARAVPDDK